MASPAGVLFAGSVFPLLILAACLPTAVATPVPTATFAPQEVLTSIATPTSRPKPVQSPSLEEILSRGQESFFLVCAESQEWVRPSEEEQRRKWWDNPRYRTDDPRLLEHIRYAWTHQFIMHYGGASPQSDLVNLTGIWTATDVTWQCEDAWRESRLGTGAGPGVEIWAEIWMLQHRVKEIRHLGRDYALVVEPTSSGFQVVDFQRPAAISLNLTFVNLEGRIIDQVAEGISPWTQEITASA